MRCVLVCGGRDYADAQRLDATLDALDSVEWVIHGGATGADLLAGRWAARHRVACCAYAAEWQRYGKAAGPIRNARMLNEAKPDLVIAFPGGRGTADMVRQARAAGVEVREVKP